VRVHQCACGCTLDRDVNAARVVLSRALQRLLTPGLVKVGTDVEGSVSTGGTSCQQAGPLKRPGRTDHRLKTR
jgi:transposase